jgi:hypothetical protein
MTVDIGRCRLILILMQANDAMRAAAWRMPAVR